MGRTFRRRRRQLKALPRAAFKDGAEGEAREKSKIGALLKYLHSLGWSNEHALTVRYFPSTGRGLCSKSSREFQLGERLLSLPASSLITIETLENDEAFKANFNSERFENDMRIPFQALLALYILYHQHLGENSPYAPYLSTLPQRFSVPYFCTMRELQCLPDSLLERTVEQNRIIKESYACISKTVELHQCQWCGRGILEEVFPLYRFKWAYFVVNTRSVYVDSRLVCSPDRAELGYNRFFKPLIRDETNLALAPFLDLFNHSDKVQTKAELIANGISEKSPRLEYVITLEDAPVNAIPRYSQIFISYGALVNLKLYTEYGFVLEQNAHDFFVFSLQDIERFLKEVPSIATHTLHKSKFKFIREHNFDDQMFVHTVDGISHNLRVVLHLLLKESSPFPNVLSQIAFGAAEQLDEMKNEIDLLIGFKIDEYKRFLGILEQLEPDQLTDSGAMAIIYMRESLRYLQSCLE